MSDRIDPSADSAQPRPWPEVADTTGFYDHGQPWCINAEAHPEVNGGYPDADHHLPWDECRSLEVFLDDARDDLDGAELGVSVYAAATFQFGEPRQTAKPARPRVVLESWRSNDENASERITMSSGEALRLAHALVRLVDSLTFIDRPA